jgi:hypothetical protein
MHLYSEAISQDVDSLLKISFAAKEDAILMLM